MLIAIQMLTNLITSFASELTKTAPKKAALFRALKVCWALPVGPKLGNSIAVETTWTALVRRLTNYGHDIG